MFQVRPITPNTTQTIHAIITPMAKTKRRYACSSCGHIEPKWMGKCPACNEWDTLEEFTVEADDKHRSVALAPPSKLSDTGPIKAVPINHASQDAKASTRHATNISELDRVLGGGIVPGSVILLGGDPGIGKSTLLLQSMAALANQGATTLYVTSEESAEQVKLRAARLTALPPEDSDPKLFVLADTNLVRIIEQCRVVSPEVLVIDSIQMVYKADMDASPGSVAQLRRCCMELVYLAKATGTAVVLVGHVTKEGTLAGPKLLEHLVDVVLSFEGDRYHAHRVVRSIKNRFGTTLEVGLFEMGGAGLREIPDGASVAANADANRPGSVVTPLITGTRCLLVEVQALTATGFPGSVKRKSSGIDASRLAMLIAVLEQHAELSLYDRDVFTSAVGGIRVNEPASDLALALAIAGAHLNKPLPPATAAVGEVGLGGEVRPVTQIEPRLREAARLGYTTLIVPAKSGARDLNIKEINLIEVQTLDQAIAQLHR